MSSPLPVAAKPRPYRRFVTSALHARFVRAASIALLWHLALAGLASDWSSSISSFFWAFFPLGLAGIKAGLFFMTSIFIFMLQIATLKLGRRCTPSNWLTIKSTLLSSSTYATLFWYLASSVWFCEVYVFTSPASKELGWIINGGYGEPDKLNERPIYLRLFFLILGSIHAFLHVYHDASSLPLPIEKEDNKPSHAALSPKLTAKFQSMVLTAAFASGLTSLVGPFLYNAIFRNTLWAWHISWARLFASIARSDSLPPNTVYIGAIVFRAFLFGFLLSLTWQFNLVLFDVFMIQPPVKQGVPLTASSKDPNGSLLNGLTAKRDLAKTFAFWELDLIAQQYPDRRKDIFADIERLNQGPMFTNMLNAALDVVKSMQSRIDAVTSSSNPASAAKPRAVSISDQDAGIQRLPRLLPDTLRAGNPIFQASTAPSVTLAGRTGTFLSNEARTLGSSSNPWSPPVEKTKQLAIEYSSPTIKDLQARAEAAQQSPLGRYLLTSPTRLIKSVVLGSPNGNPALTIHAVHAVQTMLVASLPEDAFGKAVQGVPPAVLTLTKAIFALEYFTRNHTNGGVVSESAASDLEQVLIVHQTLKVALRDLLEKFQLFLNDVGLSIRDLNEARKAAEERALFKVIKSPAGHAPVAEGLADRADLAAGANPSSRPEMEEVNRPPNNARRASGQPQQQNGNAQPRRRKSLKEQESEDADRARPGRLFSQLDQGSAYQSSLRAKKQEQRQLEDNPLAQGSKKAQVDNVLGARDFNSLPAGGLQRRRVGEVR